MISSQGYPDPLQRLTQIDAVCLEFEQRLRQSPPWTIEKALENLPIELHEEVIPELLWIEWSELRKSGESVRLEDYLERFPNYHSVVRKSWSRDLNHLQPESPIAADEIWGDRYRILHVHAAGGLGRIFIADDLQLNRRVAIKEVCPELAEQANVCERFLREARITANLEHPGIAPVYSLDIGADHPPYFAMRLIEGQTLQQEADALHRKPNTEDRRTPKGDRREVFPSLKFRELLSRLLYVCKVVDFAHSRGVIHRDIKPGNIILGRHGETMLVDWGLAKLLGEDCSDSACQESTYKSDPKREQLTHDSELVGTPAFMSPEQATRSPEAEAPAADIYSLGATLHYLLAGVPPRGGSQIGAALEKTPVRNYLFPVGTPKPLQAICRKATATNPQERYGTAGELADDIECWLADLPIKAVPEKFPTRAMRVVKRHQPWFIALSLGILGVGLIGWLYNLSLSNANKKLTEEQTRLEMARFDQERLSEQAKAHSERVTKLLISLNPNVSLLPSDEIRKNLDDWLLESAKSFAENANQPDSLEILISQLEALSALGYDVECKSLIKQAINIRKEHHQSLAPLNRFLISIAETTEEANTAIKLFEKEFSDEFADSSPKDRAILVSELGDCYWKAGRFEDLQKLLDEHLITSRENLAPNQLYHVKLTELVAGLHEHRKEFLDVIRVIRESREEYPTAISLGLSALKLDLIEARALSSLGQYAEAREMLKRMLDDLSTTVALDHPARVSVSLDYGEALYGSGQPQAALEVHNTCLNNIRSASRARRSINEADCQRAIAKDLRALGEFDEAEKYINQAIDYYSSNLPAGDQRQLSSLQEKAAIYLDSKRYEEAIPLLQQVVSDSERYAGEIHSDTLEAKNKLAVAYLFTNRSEQALELLENCFRTAASLYGEEHIESLHYLGNLCTMYVMAGKVVEGGEFIEKNYSLALSNQQGSPATYLNRAASHKGLLLLESNQLDEAWDLLTATIESEIDAGAPMTQATIESLGYLFRIAEQTGAFREAADLHLRALNNVEKLEQAPLGNLLSTELNHLRLWRKAGLEAETMRAMEMMEQHVSAQLEAKHPQVRQIRLVKASLLFEFGHHEAAEKFLNETRSFFPNTDQLDQYQLAELLWLIACKQRSGDKTAEASLRQTLPDSLREVDLSQPRIEMINAIAIQATAGSATDAESNSK